MTNESPAAVGPVPAVLPPGAPALVARIAAEVPRPANGADRRTLGAYGEELAARYLEGSGMEILARNWRCRHGELDIVACSSEITAFVEVKTRTGVGFGVPAEAVTLAKRQRIRRLALLWLTEQEQPWRTVRFDVVSILLRRGCRPVVEHLESVF